MRTNNFNFLERNLLRTVGIATGLLPPRLQLKITNGNTKAAGYMSEGSRFVNGVIPLVCGVVSITAMTFGKDVDPTPYNLLTIGSFLWTGLETAPRELSHALHRIYNKDFEEVPVPWGEFYLSALDAKLNPKVS